MPKRTKQHLSQILNDEGPERSRRKRPQSNAITDGITVSRPGVIIGMTLRNFMCHSLLEVRFSDSINFIIGKNGSGKSAILSALVVGLGGKASVTNRGTSIKGFVKAGCNSGSVEITLNNVGSLGYKPQVYGNVINVQRNFTAAGSSSYKVKDSQGAVISTSSNEVQNILLALNIQLDNPVCILNQDTSRNFLNSSDTKAKFKLFVRATRLDHLYEIYRQGIEDRRQAVRIFDEKRKTLAKIYDDVGDLKRCIEQLNDMTRMEDELNSLGGEELWALVVDAERVVAGQEAVVETLTEQREGLLENLEERNQCEKNLTEQFSKLSSEINEMRLAATQQEAPQREYTSLLSTLRTKQRTKCNDRSYLDKEITASETERNDLRKLIETATKRLTGAEQKRLDTLKRVSEVEARIKKMETVVLSINNERFQLDSDLKIKKEALTVVQRERNDVSFKIGKIKQKVEALRKEPNNALAVYGEDMTRIVQAIKASARSFNKLPKGPLGSYVSVKDRKWTLAIEGYLSKSTLQTFCVDNARDNDLLIKIMDQVLGGRPKPTIIICKFSDKVYDVSRFLVKSTRDCVSIYQAITVPDAVIMNCLIDQMNIESILLVPDDNKAMALCDDIENVPQNCSLCITPAGDRYHPAPNYRTYCSTYHQARYLQADVADVIGLLQKELEKMNNEQDEVNHRHAELQKAVDKSTTEVGIHTEKLNKCRQAVESCRRTLFDLRNVDFEENGNVQRLESELKEVEATMKAKLAQREALQAEINGLKAEVVAAEAELSKLSDVDTALSDRIKPLEAQLRALQNEREELKTNNEFEGRRLSDCRSKLRDAKIQLQSLQRKVNSTSKQAVQVRERPDEIRESAALRALIEQMSSVLRRLRTKNMDADQLFETLTRKSSIISRTSQVMDVIKKDLDELTSAYERRKRQCKQTRDYFESLINHCFRNFLEMRQYKGQFKVDFENATLDLVVIPQQGIQGITPTTNLSGGERSFSTVAFLYSLWQCLDFPFYFLDEFDVFMDKANRTKVMDILIEHAKSNSDMQFVFLTPQDVSFVQDKSVAIHRLDDPERRATQ